MLHKFCVLAKRPFLLLIKMIKLDVKRDELLIRMLQAFKFDFRDQLLSESLRSFSCLCSRTRTVAAVEEQCSSVEAAEWLKLELDQLEPELSR